MARHIPIRGKLAAALAIPITALLVVAGLEVLHSTREADEVEEQTDLATASIGPSGLINSLQNERNYASLWLLGFEDDVQVPAESFDDAKRQTDAALASFRADVEGKGGEVAETYAPALGALDGGLAELRRQVDTYEGERLLSNTDVANPNFAGYTELTSALFDANTQVALAIDDPILRRGVELTDISSRQTDLIARTIRSLLLSGLSEGGLDRPEELADASALFGQVRNNRAQITSLGTGVYQDTTDRLIEESDATGFIPLVEQTLAKGGTVPIVEIFETVDINQETSYYGHRSRVEDILVDRADELNAAAARTRNWFIVLAGVAVAVAVGVTWLVSRSITRPLRSLTGQATTMADHRLPEAVLDILDTPLGEDVDVPEVEPVTVHTRDEVSDVAEALNTVQDSALDLAVEQAVLRRNIADSFVNLGRRNQNLLGRQLDFITELETNETDPNTLANLFRLDHLATRMRRNAESLLVLAGVEPPRKWAAPVRLTDVIRAALGEVEDYQRVSVRGVEPATIVGAAAADLAHLLAELVENALVFSPPDQVVDIRGRCRLDGYTLAIIDSGLGMPPADIEAANRRLAGEESFTVAPSKYLGHYVAGNLAARHGIAVRLDNSPGNGVTATIDLPPDLLTTDAGVAEPAPVPVSQAVRSAQAPPAATAAPIEAEAAGNAMATYGIAPAPPAPPGPVPVAGPTGPRPGTRPAARTASGLVKRAPQAAPNRDARVGDVPAGDLLASLSSIATNAAGHNLAAPPPPTRPTQPQPPAGGARHGPPPQGPPRQGPTPPPAGRPSPPPPAGRPSPPPSAGRPSPPPPAGRAPAGPPPWSPQAPGARHTAGGLTRRVRGANLPTTEPVSLRRTGEHPRVGEGAADGYGRTPGPAPRGGGNDDGHESSGARHDDSSARDVYSFLTSFTAGVQRGLDEAKRHPKNPQENGQ